MKIIKKWCTVCIVLCCVFVMSVAVQATSSAKNLDGLDYLNSHCFYDENGNIDASVMFVDGDYILLEGTDYQLEVKEDEGGYVIEATGLGSYDGTWTTWHSGVHEVYTTEEWKFLVNSTDVDEEEGKIILYCNVIEYLGDETVVSVPRRIENGDTIIYVDGIVAGTFTQISNITSIEIPYGVEVYDYIVVDCPTLQKMTINATNGGNVADFIYGDVAEDFTLKACYDYYMGGMAMEEYCSDKGYNFEDVYEYLIQDGITYAYIVDSHSAKVVNCEESVVNAEIGFSIVVDGVEYYIDEISYNAFKDLPNLKFVDLQSTSIKFDLPLCANCPNLEQITIQSTNWSIGEYDLITGELNNSLTVSARKSIAYYVMEYDEENDEYVQTDELTIKEYCEAKGYTYKAAYPSISNVAVYINEVGVTNPIIIEGSECQAILWYLVDGAQDWQGLAKQSLEWSTDSEYITIDEQGNIIYEKPITESTAVTVTANATLYDKEYEVNTMLFVSPRLKVASTTQWEIEEESLSIECQQRISSSESAAVPDDAVVTYTSADTSIVEVDEDGTLVKGANAKVGDKVRISISCVIDEQEYVAETEVEFVEAEDTDKNKDEDEKGEEELGEIEEPDCADGHTYGSWKVTKEAQCDKAGEKSRQCTVCGHIETAKIPAAGFVKGGKFEKSNVSYKIKSKKGKKGTVVYQGISKKSKKVIIPKTVKIKGTTYTVVEIAAGAFSENTKITSVTIPEGVTKIGKNAFCGCKNLKTITIKSTKLTKNTVGKNAFKGTNKKLVIKVPKKKVNSYKKFLKTKGNKKVTVKKG